MSHFQELLASVRSALSKPTPPAGEHRPPGLSPVPVAPAARRAELGSRFVRELEAVGGHAIQVSAAAEVGEEIARLARERNAGTIAIGQGLTVDLPAVARELARQGLEILHAGPVVEAERRELRERMAQAAIGVAEADYGIASSGTLAVLANASRPRTLTLLPPISVIIVHVDRILADLAAVMRALEPAVLAGHHLSLITGPSRTADIEKRIVTGVHGPKELWAVVIWPEE